MPRILRLALVAGLMLSTSYLTAQIKSYKLTNYGPRQYGNIYEATNMCSAQDPRGIFYFGTANGLLEFDGYFWRFIPVKTGLWIRSLAIDSANIIYIGAQNEFGYLKIDSLGNFAYQSLSDSVKNKTFPFSSIWKIHILNNKVYFQAEENIFEYDGKNTRMIDPETSYHTSFMVNNRLFVRQREIGLMELINGALVLVKKGDLFKQTGVFGMFSISKKDNRIMLFTQESGFWIMDKSGITKYTGKLNQTVASLGCKIFGCDRVVENELALSTFSNGIYFVTLDGKVISNINQTKGMPDNNINSLTKDLENNLWLSTNKGITRIDNNSDLSVFTKDDGVDGSVNALFKYNGNLYIGTSGKMLVQNISEKDYSGKSFIAIPNFEKQVWKIVQCENTLVAGTNDGIYKITGSSVNKVSEIDAYCLGFIASKKLLVAGGSKGLTLYHAENFKVISNIALEIDVKGLAIDESNPDNIKIWLGSNYMGVTKISIDKAFNMQLRQYTTEDGLVDGTVIPFLWNGKVLFNNNQTVLTFVSEEEIRAGLPDSMKNNEKYCRGYFDTYPFPYKKNIYCAVQDRNKTWISTGLEMGFIKNGDSIFQNTAFKAAELGKINTIYPDDNGDCWIGATEGLIKYESGNTRKYDIPYNCLIRKVMIGNDSIVYNGNEAIINSPTFKYSNNSISFEYSATYYNIPEKLRFSYTMEGLTDKWSEWDDRHSMNYENLREGHYVFLVRAKNVYGNISKTAAFVFTILPPWYRSWWAITIYILFGVLFIWFIVKLNTYRLQEKNKQLERIVEERTREVVAQKEKIEGQNADLERQNHEILTQKAEITDSIKYAKRIQSASLPSIKIAKKYIDDIFVLYKPRDIVSGDFYWCTEVDNMLIIVAADCTGHGVPGAFMSMLGMSFLNNIILDKGITDTGSILDQLRNSIISSLHQRDSEFHSKDGMDICLCAIDKTNKVLYYSGAFNPLIKIRNGELVEHDVDRMPVAVSEFNRNFVTRKVEVEPGDCLYMFTDGYIDQFGGPRNKKFMKLNFKNKLVDIHKMSMCDQLAELDLTIENYRGNNFQTDDILVIGMRI
jgi:serine phosphatase RsbU (regulator of sigma subunit)